MRSPSTDPAPGWDQSRAQAIGLVLVAALSTAVMGLFAKEALKRGSDAQALLAVRYVITGVLLALPLLITRSFPAGSPRARRRALAIGVGMFFGGSFEFEALSRLPLSVVIVILFVSPLWVALYSRVFRGERLGLGRQLAFVSVFAGIVCLVGPALGDYDVVGLLCALASSFIWAGILLGIQGAEEIAGFSPPVAVASGAIVACVVAFLIQPAAVVNELGAGDRLPWVLGVGLAAAVGFGLISLGMRGQHVFDVSVVAATEPLFAAALGALFLSERLSAVQLLGIALVALGVVLIARSYEQPGTGRPSERLAPI
jgi:drug/metabolite transporter (DMT)-like permease